MPTRREILKKSSAAAAIVAAPAFVRGQNLNSKIQLASIGSDGKGWSDTEAMAMHDTVEHVSFCDVDLNRTLKVKRLQPDAPIYQNFQEMLAAEGDKIDAVTVSTPDHMHAFCSIAAMRAGKHVYCQKPLTHNVWESRQVSKMAAKAGVITRLGNQIHSHQYYRTAVQLIQSGRIGKVTRVHSWVGTTGHGRSGLLDRPAVEEPIPDTLDWDSWIGVAPMRPYGGARVYHPFTWRDWQEFGGGALGDFGCHIFDPVFTALKITEAPTQIQADHTGINDEVWPAQSTVNYTMPGTELTADSTFKLTWYDGGRRPNRKGSHIPGDRALPASGSMLIGETGTLVIPHVGKPQLYFKDAAASTEFEMAEGKNHYHGWVDGCLGKEQPSDGFDYGALLTETVQLGNVAFRFRGKTLEWDSKNMKVTNIDEANPWLTREYRKGWEIQPV